MRAAGILDVEDDRWRSKVRFSTLDSLMLAHSAHPTAGADSVFFGPDTYRFCRLLASCTPQLPRVRTAVDVGCGTGAGGIFLASQLSNAWRIILADINDVALSFSSVNCALNDIECAECRHSDVLADVPEPVDLVISNPPYLVDPAHRIYRDGGGEFGIELSSRIAFESVDRLRPGGFLILYTGTPVIAGVDILRKRLLPLLNSPTLACTYSEIDPDVFGEELDNAAYREADRIAAIGFIACKS
jgi:methylase of polypeptide subunit release factors